jgi:chromosome segregation ATPase
VIESPEQKHARALRELARYGDAPEQWFGWPLYAMKVMLRKRELLAELNALSAQRKRADDAAQEALAKLGEAIYARRGDPELAVLSKQLSAVADVESHVGQVQAEAHKRKQHSTQEIARLDAEIERAEALTAPLKEREATIAATVEELKARARRSDLQRRKVEGEMEALQKSKGGVDPERWRALQGEREAFHGEVQSLGVQLRPVEDDLGVVRRELTQHMKRMVGLQDEKQWTAASLERAQQTHRVSEGSARGARQQILVALAQSARKHGLTGAFPEAMAAVTECSERAGAKRQQEDFHRTAMESFDAETYRKGTMALLGGSGLLLLTLTILIFL